MTSINLHRVVRVKVGDCFKLDESESFVTKIFIHLKDSKDVFEITLFSKDKKVIDTLGKIK